MSEANSTATGFSLLGSLVMYVVQGALGLGFVVGALLYVYQDKLLYFPTPPGAPVKPEDNPHKMRSPAEWRLPFEEKLLETKDGCTIHTWLMLQPDSKRRATLIYFHGNAGNMGFRLPNAHDMYKITGLNVLMMDYRGYGKSTGTPSEEGLNVDAELVLNYALQHPALAGSPLIAFGRSLGGAVAIALAEKFPEAIRAVVVENTFLSISSMVDTLMPLVSIFKPLVLRIRWDSDVKIQKLKQPIMYISGDSDELVPPLHMKKLHELATSSTHKDFYRVLGGTHNDTWVVGGSTYYKRLKEFVSNVLGSQTCSSSTSDESTSSGAIPTMKRDFNIK